MRSSIDDDLTGALASGDIMARWSRVAVCYSWTRSRPQLARLPGKCPPPLMTLLHPLWPPKFSRIPCPATLPVGPLSQPTSLSTFSLLFFIFSAGGRHQRGANRVRAATKFRRWALMAGSGWPGEAASITLPGGVFQLSYMHNRVPDSHAFYLFSSKSIN